MKKTLTLFLLVLFLAFNLKAQDIHYSQFYNSPLTLNPALTGVNDCNYRISANYRTQYGSVTTPYKTPSISFDMNNLAPRLIKKGTASAGLLILNDKAGDGGLTNLSVMASGAYQISLDPQKKMSVSLGLQLGLVQKWFDLSKLTFEDQFDGKDFVGTTSLWEASQGIKSKSSYFNLNLGGLFSYKPSEKLDLYLGVAGFNLISPKEAFYSKSKNKLGLRPVIHAGARIGLNDKISLLPVFLYMGQSSATEINFGTSFGYTVKPEFTFFLGGYYRMNDAVIAMIAGEYKKIKLGLSYDINTSTLKSASNGSGGFEISLSYVGCLGGLILDKAVLYPPRF